MKDTVSRENFIQDLVRNCSFTYVQATAAYESFIKTLENGICSGTKVNFSRIGNLVPVKYPPREVSMGFTRRGSSISKSNKTYYLGSRIKFKFNLYKKFQNSKKLDWKLD